MFTEKDAERMTFGVKMLMAATKTLYDSAKEVGFSDEQAFCLASDYMMRLLDKAEQLQEGGQE